MGMVKQGFGIGLLVCALGILSLHAQYGSFDATFHPNVAGTTQGVRAMASQANGKAVVVGDFESIDGRGCRGVARFNADGTPDTDFAKGLPGTDGPVYCVSIQVDGKIVIGGDFSTVHGRSLSRIARLNADGTVDTTFAAGSGVNGPVYAVAAMTSSSMGTGNDLFPVGILIGGDFTLVQGAARNRIALLGKNGTLTSNYYSGTGANGPVYAICPTLPGYANGVYVAGDFTQINGTTRNRIAYMNSVGSISSFNSSAESGPDGPVYSLAYNSSNRRVYFGGDFRNYGGKAASYLAAIDSYGQLAEGFPSGSLAGPVRAMAANLIYTKPKTTMSLYFGCKDSEVGHIGLITEVSVTTASSIVTTTTMEEGYAQQVDGTINGLLLTRDDKLIIGGKFTSVGGDNQADLARLYGSEGSALPHQPGRPIASVGTDTKIFLNWSKVGNATGHAIERSPDGAANWDRIISGEVDIPYIDNSLQPGTTYHYRVIALNSNGGSFPSEVTSATTLPQPWALSGALDMTFQPRGGAGSMSQVAAFAVQRDGKILATGNYGYRHKMLARFDSNGVIDEEFHQGEYDPATIYSLAVQSDGKIIVGGSFSTLDCRPANGLGRLLPNGSCDTGFRGGDHNGYVKKVLVLPDDRVIIAGGFSSVGSGRHYGVALLSAQGRVDETFNAQLLNTQLSTNGSANDAVVQPDGKIVIVGSFQSANDVTRGNIARFNPDGTLDVDFAAGAGANGTIDKVVLQQDGKLVICGSFTTYDGVDCRGLGRLNVDGSLDTTFNPGPVVISSANVSGDYYWGNSLAIQEDGKIILGGMFAIMNGKVRMRIARFLPDGSVDESFLPGLGANNSVTAIFLQPDGKCLIGGYFTDFNGTQVGRMARLLTDNGTSAPSAPLTVTATAVSTSSTQLTWDSVAFSSGYQIYQSIDGVSDWTLVDTVPSSSHSTLIAGLPAGSSRHYQVRAFSSNGYSPDSVMVTGTSFTPYQQWKVNQSLPLDAPDTEDAIGKGVPHLLDYAFGGDPLAYDAQATLPRLDVPDNQMQITFWCDTDRSDLDYTVQASTDLIHWEDIAQCNGGATAAAVNAGSVVSDTGSGRRKVSVTDLSAIGTNQQRYLRVKVTTR